MEPAIQVSEVVKTYPFGVGEVVAVDHLSLTVARGEFVAVVGRLGSGKTTLLNLLAGIDRPTAGTVHAAGADLGRLSESGLAAWRGRNVGLVFQFFQLLPTLAVVLNQITRKNTVPGVHAGDTVQLLIGGNPTSWRVVGVAQERTGGSGVYATAEGFAAATRAARLTVRQALTYL